MLDGLVGEGCSEEVCEQRPQELGLAFTSCLLHLA